MAAKFVVDVKVTGEGSRTLTAEELQKAINFGLNWHHGHHYTKATFEVEVRRAHGVALPDGGQSNG